MATGNETATFSLNIESNAATISDDAATSLEGFRSRIEASEKSLKDMSGSLRRLKGSTDEVKSAKEELAAKIQAERNAISAAQVGLLKAGASYDQLALKAKKLASAETNLAHAIKTDPLKDAETRASAMGKAIQVAGGPVQSLKDRFETLKSVAGGTGGALGAVTFAAAGLAAGLAALVAASGAAVISFAKWAIAGSNAARTANLVREAATGSAENAKNLGDQIDLLSTKVSTSKGALQELAVSLGKTRLSGQATVDTFNAVARAADAMGDATGSKIKEIVERGQTMQRLQISPQELFGTGLDFTDIAKELSTQLNVGIKEAQTALFQGRVKLDAGAKALRAAVEARFGQINAAKLLDLDVMAEKLHERFQSLTKGVNLTPLVKAFQTIGSVFDETTVSGSTLKSLVTLVGSGLVSAFAKVAPIAKTFMKGLIIGALDVAIGFYVVKNKIRDTFAGSDFLKKFDTMKAALLAGKVVIYGVAAGLALVAASMVAIGVGIAALAVPFVTPFVLLYAAVTKTRDLLAGINWTDIGRSIVDGLVNGLKAGAAFLKESVTALADSIKTGFTGALGIHSPSKVFAQYGQFSAEGYAQGVDRGAPEARASLASLTAPSGKGDTLASIPPPASKAAAAGGKASGAPVTINLNFNVAGGSGGGGEEAAASLKDPGFLSQLTKAVRDGLISAGMPVSA